MEPEEIQCLRCGQLCMFDDVSSVLCEECLNKEWEKANKQWEKDEKHLQWEYERSRF